MKFAIGYQLPDEDDSTLAIVRDFREHVHEVYFPWLSMPSGRSPMMTPDEAADEGLRACFEGELAEIAATGVKLDLLLNASCYGAAACSRSLVDAVHSVIVRLLETSGLHAVTTMSPIIAEAVKRSFPRLDVRASVNMRLGTVQAMQYVADMFDSFYVQREFNRDITRLMELKAWADANGKRLFLLANSGCLNWCAVQTFHDNLVAHEAEAALNADMGFDAPPQCWRFLMRPENRVFFLRNSWIRPEDLHHYEHLFDVVKLATRMHANPRRVVEAYAGGAYSGNLPDLFEPGHGALFAPRIIDNTRFPADWFQRTSACDKLCHKCGYCDSVMQQVLV